MRRLLSKVVFTGDNRTSFDGYLGADTFFIDHQRNGGGEGRDFIVDFNRAEGDKIALISNINGTGITTFAQLVAAMSAASVDGEQGTEIAIGSSNFVFVSNVAPQQFITADFLFV